MTGCKPRQRSERPTLPEKNLTIQLDLFTAQKTDGTPRGEHREEVQQNVVQDFWMNGPCPVAGSAFEDNATDFIPSLI